MDIQSTHIIHNESLYKKIYPCKLANAGEQLTNQINDLYPRKLVKRKLRVNFPPNDYLIKSYKRPEQFQSNIKWLNYHLMGFHDVFLFQFYQLSKWQETFVNKQEQIRKNKKKDEQVELNKQQNKSNYTKCFRRLASKQTNDFYKKRCLYIQLSQEIKQQIKSSLDTQGTDKFFIRRNNHSLYNTYDDEYLNYYKKWKIYPKVENQQIEDSQRNPKTNEKSITANRDHGYYKQIWSCRQCYAYILYIWNQQSHKFELKQYNNTHYHFMSKFQKYIIFENSTIPMNGYQRQSQYFRNHNYQQYSSHKNDDLMESNVYSSFFSPATYKYSYDVSNHSFQYQQPNSFIKKDRNKRVASQSRKIIQFLIQQSQYNYQPPIKLPSGEIHQFFPSDVPNQPQMMTLRSKLMYWAYKLYPDQFFRYQMQRKKQSLDVRCFCRSSFFNFCNFSLIYSSTDDQHYKYQPNKSNPIHHHIEHKIIYSNTKNQRIYNEILIARYFKLVGNAQAQLKTEKLIEKSFKNKEYKKKKKKQPINIEKMKTQSILYIFSPEILKQLFQLGYKILARQIQCSKLSEIVKLKANLSLCEKNNILNDYILLIHPNMCVFFRAYPKVLVIQEKKLQVNSQQNIQFSMIKLKGISYSGIVVCFGISLCRSINRQKAYLIIQKFQTEHVSIPSTVICEKQNTYIYKAALNYYGEKHPQTRIKVKLNTKRAPFTSYSKQEIMQIPFYTFTDIQIKETKRIAQSKDIDRQSVSYIFDYQNIMKEGFMFSYESNFLGVNHQTFLMKQSKADIKLQNVEQILKKEGQKEVCTLTKQIMRKESRFQPFYQAIFNSQRLQTPSHLMTNKTFHLLIENLKKIPKLTISVDQSPHFCIVDSLYSSNIVLFEYGRSSCMLSCDCKQSQKTGLPCEHILKVSMIKVQVIIEDCINKFWMINPLILELRTIKINRQLVFPEYDP